MTVEYAHSAVTPVHVRSSKHVVFLSHFLTFLGEKNGLINCEASYEQRLGNERVSAGK